jgi:hypothetical protein
MSKGPLLARPFSGNNSPATFYSRSFCVAFRGSAQFIGYGRRTDPHFSAHGTPETHGDHLKSKHSNSIQPFIQQKAGQQTA